MVDSVPSMSGMHFDGMAAEYESARPPYPAALYDLLAAEGVSGPGKRLLEIGAGTGQATAELAGAGCTVTAIEPGAELAAILKVNVPSARVLVQSVEEVDLSLGAFDAVVAATSIHWVNLDVGLPAFHAALVPGGSLAVWRHRFSSDVDTEFRRRVSEVVARRPDPVGRGQRPNSSSMEELAAGGFFAPVRSESWQWSIDLRTDQVRRLFRTFPDWSSIEVNAVARAADELGGVVTENYQTLLHLLKRVD